MPTVKMTISGVDVEIEADSSKELRDAIAATVGVLGSEKGQKQVRPPASLSKVASETASKKLESFDAVVRRTDERERASKSDTERNADHLAEALDRIGKPVTAREVLKKTGEMELEFVTNSKDVLAAVRHAMRRDPKERFDVSDDGWALKEWG